MALVKQGDRCHKICEAGSRTSHSQLHGGMRGYPVGNPQCFGPGSLAVIAYLGAFYRSDWFQGLTFSKPESPQIHPKCWMGRAGIPQGALSLPPLYTVLLKLPDSFSPTRLGKMLKNVWIWPSWPAGRWGGGQAPNPSCGLPFQRADMSEMTNRGNCVLIWGDLRRSTVDSGIGILSLDQG